MAIDRSLMPALTAWKDSTHRKPLILRGPRQVGKTWLLKEFGSRAFDDVAYFNFEESLELRPLFDVTRDPRRILEHLQAIRAAPIVPGKTLVIFDEIQECNGALISLKYFCENLPEQHIAAAGSLLGVALSRPSSFPVGKVDFLDLRPLTFSEFLIAVDDASPLLYLGSRENLEPVPDIFFSRLTEHLARYLLIGGMPRAVLSWSEKRDMGAVMAAQRAVLDAFQLDFAKHTPDSDIAKVGHLWRSLPSQLARDNRKFLYSAAREGARARSYENALYWLVEMGIVTRVTRVTTPKLPLAAYDDPTSFKLYVADTGLLSRLAELDPSALSGTGAPFTEFKGALTENYVLQSLVGQFDAPPRYWTSTGKAEVEFLLQRRNDIHPIEVKAGASVRSQSLGVYRAEHSPRIAVRLSQRNLQFRDGLLDVPLFMADHLDRLIQLALESIG